MKLSNRFSLLLFVNVIIASKVPALCAMLPPRKKARFYEYQKRRKQVYDKAEVGKSLLLLATEYNHVADAKFLLDSGVSPLNRYNGPSLLDLAVRSNSFEVAQLLIQQGLPVNRDFPQPLEKPPLHSAFVHNRPHFIQLLVAAGAHLNEGIPLLRLLSPFKDHIECVKALFCTPTHEILRTAKVTLLVFMRLGQDQGYGIRVPLDVQKLICKIYITQCLLHRAQELCDVNYAGETAYDSYCQYRDMIEFLGPDAACKHKDIAQLIDPDEPSLRRKLIWDHIGKLMAGKKI